MIKKVQNRNKNITYLPLSPSTFQLCVAVPIAVYVENILNFLEHGRLLPLK